MSRCLPLLLSVLFGAYASSLATLTQAAVDLAITHVTVIDVQDGRSLPNHTVMITGSRIVQVAPSAQVRIPAGAQVVTAEGKYLIPGLWDAHVHSSFTGASMLPLFVVHGITSMRDLGGRLEEVKAMRRQIAAGEIVGPRIMIAGPVLEGGAWMQAAYQIAPPEHPIWAAAPRVIVSKENVQAAVDSLKAQGVDLVKARNVWGTDFLALAAAAERAGLPLASHNPNGVSMRDAARSGLRSFEHAESIWGDFETMTVVDRERMFRDVAEVGTLVVPTLMGDVGLIISSDSEIMAAIADTEGQLDPRNRYLPRQMRTLWADGVEQRRKYGAHPKGTFEKIVRDVRAMNRSGIRMLAGTDVGGVPLVYPGSSLHQELELLVREGGLTTLAALQSATRNPPHFFRMQHQLGAIEHGQIADLVLLDASPLADIRNTRKIAGVVLNGKYLDRRALDHLLAEVGRAAHH